MMSVFVLVSCASSKKNNDESSVNSENNKGKKTDKKKKQNFVGWIDGSLDPIAYEKGIVKIRAIPSLGSFNISAVNARGKAVPVLLSSNEYVSTSFYLYTEKRIYKLAAGAGVRCSAKLNDDGIELYYSIKNVADVDIVISCFSSTENAQVDMIKFSAGIQNISSRNEKFALKAIFDTVLGESDKYHFYLPDGTSIKNENQFPNAGEGIKPWIISKNDKASIQFLFYGADITKPEYVYAANYSTLDTQNWYPNLLTFRSFDTVYAYNNSALGINWSAATIKPEQNASYIMYAALAVEEDSPRGQYFIHPELYSEKPEKEEKREVIPEETEFVEEPVIEPVTKSTSVKNQEPVVEEKVPEPVVEPKPKTEQPAKQEPKPRIREKKEPETPAPEDIPVVQFDVLSLSKEQLEPEYIQNLINRITVLEESGQAVNRAELLQLNAELDAILEILRQN